MGATNCPETPRQKMISMMYLVLLAMMAMNVSVEVLNAFRVVDSNLVQTYSTINTRSEHQYNALESAYQLNKAKVGPWLSKADSVIVTMDSLNAYISDLKAELALHGGGQYIKDIEGFVATPDRSFVANSKGDSVLIAKDDDLNAPAELMIRLGKATELKDKIDEAKTLMLSMVEDSSVIANSITQTLDTSDPVFKKKTGEGRVTWEIKNFSNQPLIAVITIMSKLQIDVANTKSNMLTWLNAQIDAGSYKFNKLTPVVNTQTSAILEGATYRAEVFLAAEDTTQTPKILVGGKPLPIEAGKGIYSATPSKAGVYSYNGTIQFTGADGDILEFPFEHEYQVIKPSATISPTKMNVFYLNIANPISVSVPGVSPSDVRVTMSNGRIKQQGGQTVVFPSKEDVTGKNTNVFVDVNLDGKTRRVASMSFRVKRVPDPIAQVAGKSGGAIRKEDFMAEQGIFAELIDFDFDLRFKVVSFDVTLSNGGYNNTYTSNSASFTPQMKQQFASLQPGSIVYIDNIMTKGGDGTTRQLPPLSFKLR